MNTPTPRTDDAQWGTGKVTTDFARTLERELAHERERSRLLLTAMNERDDGYIESRKRMSALESALAAEREKVRALRNALQSLHDEQNGAPLRRRRDHWQMAMNNASSALAATENTP